MHAPIRRLLVALAVIGATIACGDSPAPTAVQPTVVSHPEASPLAGPESAHIAVVGVLEEVRGSVLLVRQQGPTVPARTPPGRVELPLGQVGDLIEVSTDVATEVYVAGAPATIDALRPGTRLIASGERSGPALRATRVSDLASIAAPTEAMRDALRARLDPASRVEQALVPRSPLAAAALCASQDFDYDDGVDDFQGCWGGPSVTGSYDNPDVPLACPTLGCFVLERISYTLALGGWSFAFPYRFSATGTLVYHVPGSVTLGLEALPATTGTFTFGGGVGVDFGFTLSFCWIVGGCDDLGTYHISPYSTAHQATGQAPFTGQVLPIAEVGCPSIPVAPLIPGVVDMLGLGLCEDLSFRGAPFAATVQSGNASPPVTASADFDGAPLSFTMRPNARTASVRFDTFEYVPTLAMGFYFRVKAFGVKIVDTPSIAISDGPFHAVTTPFPLPGSAFSENVAQPTSRTIELQVDPAPTTLTIVSPSALVEGTPVRVRLAEAYDGSRIASAPVTLTVTGEGQVMTLSGTTGADGIVSFQLANGQYTVSAAYAGSDVYLPSQSAAKGVWVYQPTTFVVWGGNSGGVQIGSRYLFWGSQWWKEITAGDYEGDASFKGFASQVTDHDWTSSPGASAPPPAAIRQLVGVIVSTRVRGHGTRAEGDIADWVILRVDDPRAFAPSAGHPAHGVMLRRIADTPE